MKKIVFCFLGCLLIGACKENPQPEQVVTQNNKTSSSFKMYEMSEMAALKEQMYADNQRIKQKIENNDLNFGEFPEYYLKIHSAQMTDSDDFDDFFKSEALKFIEAQRLVYIDTTDVKKNFNNMVNSCIECHHKKCTGPIERIKKLYIE